MSCPQGFEKTLNGNCRMSCPDDFKFMQDPPMEKCVHKLENGIEVALNIIPTDALKATFDTERTRFNTELAEKRNYYKTLEAQTNELQLLKDQYTVQGARLSSIQTEYTGYKALEDVKKRMEDVNKSIKPLRSPESDIEKERKAILSLTEKNLLLVQVVLAILIASLISYLLLPVNAAHGLTFLLLCVAIAVGIFLKE
jgi:hypothetical protein